MSNQDLSELLKEHDLSTDKWEPLFHNEGITTKVHVTANKHPDELFESLSSKVDTEEEMRSLRNMLEIHEATKKYADREVERDLADAGLEPTHWLPILKTQLGVRTPQGLLHLGSESYSNLERFARNPLEKKALRKLLGIKDEEVTMKLLREKQKEKLRQREEKSQQILEELKNLQKQGKSYHDRKFKHLMDGVQEALQIPEGLRMGKDGSLEILLSDLEMIIEQLGGDLKASMDLTDAELLQHSSGGRALQGVLVSRNLEDQFEIHENMLSVPLNAQLKAPSLSQDDKIEEFFSLYQEDLFTKSMEKLGYSVTASAKAGFLCFGFQVGASYSKVSEIEKMGKHHQKGMYCSTIKYSFMPMASFHFKDSQLQLSEEALKDLQAIEAFSGSQSASQTQCECFFRKYGSHANKGQLHLGGIYWLKCYSYGFHESELAEVKKLQGQAISASVGFVHENFGASVEGNVSKLIPNFKNDFSEVLIGKTTIEVTKMGGPQTTSNIPQWKSGLVASNTTWNVIDRGSNTVPVWDIVQMNHMKCFEDPKRLVQILIVAWEEMTKLHARSLGGKIALQEQADSVDMLVDVDHWNSQKDEKNCRLHLKQLVQLKQKLVMRSMTPRVWPVLYLSKPAIQNYLKWVVKVMEDNVKGENQECLEYTKLLMQQLVDPSDLNLVENFPDKHFISKWLYESHRVEGILPLKCEDILSLQNFFRQAQDNLYLVQTKSSIEPAQQDAKIYATTCVAHVVNHLRNHLHKAQQKYEDLFVVTLLYPFRYDISEKIFLRLLSTDDLEYLIKSVQKHSTEYFKVRETSLLKKQAYLFHLALSVLDSATSIDVSESHVKQHFLYMQTTLENELHSQVEDVIIANHMNSETGYDWTAIQSDLSSLMLDLPQEHEGPTLEEILVGTREARDKKSTAAQSTVIQEDTHTKRMNIQSTKLQKEATQTFQALLKTLKLEEYYPQKLTPTDAVCIRKETLGSLQYTEQPELLPYYILQKIMMHNYKCRANILHSPQNIADTDSDSDSDDDQYFDAEEHHRQLTVCNVHPMDGLLALIHCADNFLRQDLMAKLSTCKLAIPLLLPDPQTHTLTFPLWAMQSIVKEWKSNGREHECRIVDCETPIVSFLRFSESEISKSKLLNDVIGDSEHRFFFHWDCEGGNAKRILVDGLVEVCWYLPSGKETDLFPDIVGFTNLHGDAREHDKQAMFLSKISFMNFVLLTQNDLKNGGLLLLQNLAQAPGRLVLMFSDAKEKDHVKIPQEMLLKKTYSKIKLKKKNAATIKNEIIQKLTKHAQSVGGVSKRLTDCTESAKVLGIHVDEDIQECNNGKQLAKDLIAKIGLLDTDRHSKASVKNRILPLQGPAMWHAWANLDKEQHRHTNRGFRGIQQYNSEKEDEKRAIRRRQFKETNSPTPVMKNFLQTMLEHEGTIRDFFLQWLKLLLDDRSRSLLPSLQRQYKLKRKEMNKLKHQQHVDTSTLQKLTVDLEKLNEQLLHASFGLEHLLREFGQIYESVRDVSKLKHHGFLHKLQWQMIKPSKQLRSEIRCLPQVAAELLVSGYPIELMDGDAAHVPLTWVNSVLDKVKEMLGDKQLFVISVLGVQSTGKSTLLNTMFGLKFSVSAGRCTRGAFFQLLLLNEQLKEEVKCDYLLIVDTEGLRAPELDSEGTQKHDNEMATFVIGLADVTVINIFGEAPGDMDDILQTAVHAFLRMKNVELKPSCQFVHQNVTAVLADAKGKMGRDKFHEKLDEMTRAAAKEEQCEGDYQTFNDVICFDDDEDVWYFPTLWKGDPPMAPVNPGYSDMAQKLKSRLFCMATQKGSQCTISGFQSRVKQLWVAVLDENFVFSFKNTLEITAYNELDVKYTQWSWRLQRTLLEWEQENEAVIRNSAYEKLHNLQNARITSAKAVLVEVHQKIKDEMKKFFEESRHRTILEQWQSRTQRKLEVLLVDGEKQAEEHCRTLIRSREAYVSIDRMRDGHREELQKHVNELVSKVEGKKLQLCEAQLQSMFEEKWTEWMQGFAAKLPNVYKDDVDIDASIQSCLRIFLKQQDQEIKRELLQTPLQKRGKLLKLAIQADKHLHSCRWWVRIQDEDVWSADSKTKRFLDTAMQYLHDLKKRHIQVFSVGYITDLFNKLFESVNQFNHSSHNFRFTQSYKVDIALTVGGYALHQFEEILRVIKKENDPIEYLKTLKVPFYMTFKSQYLQTAKEKTAADNLCYLLETPIITAVIGSLGHMIADDMKTIPTFHSKKALKARILMDLGEKSSFGSFVQYLTDTKASLQGWVKLYTEKHCSHTIGGKSRLKELAEVKLQGVIMSITEAAREATQFLPLPEKANISDWLSQLHRQLRSVLALNRGEISHLVGVENLSDFKFFTEEFMKGLRKIQESLLENFEFSPLSQMDSWNKKPHDVLCGTMLGCCEQCPFCKEMCELTTSDHDCKHSIALHRPECLGGYRTVSTGEMALEICSSDVASNTTFQNADTGFKPHPFKKFQVYYPNWIITPDSSYEASSYWKWFVANYSSQIAKHFNMKEVKIPDTWTALTWEEVKEDLKNTYCL